MSTDAPERSGPRPPQLRAAVAEEVRALMGRRRMSAIELARRIGKSHTYVGRRLNAETAFDLDDLERIAGVLSVSVTDLMPASARQIADPGIVRASIGERDKDVLHPPSPIGSLPAESSERTMATRPHDRRPPGHSSATTRPKQVRTARIH